MHKLTTILSAIAFAITTTLEILISLLITCLIGPIFLLIWILNELIRSLISLSLHLQYGRKMSLVPDGADNIWHYKKPGNNRMCVIAMFSDNPIRDLDDQRLQFLTRVILKQLPCGLRPYEKLTKTFTTKFGYHCFREDEFHIGNHVRMWGQESSNDKHDIDKLYTEDEFLSDILPQLSKDMDNSKPQWEQVIIPRVKCADREVIQSVRCFRYHHAYMDGATANLMFSHCLYDLPPANFPHIIDTMKQLNVPKFKLFLIKSICILSAGYTMVKTIYKAARIKGRFVTKTYSGKRHFSWSDKLNAGILRKVKSATNVSVPTILATATGSALRKMAILRNNNSQNDEKQVVLGLITALLPYSDIRPKNQFTLTHFNLPIGEMTWMKRMFKVDKEVRGIPFDPAFYLNRFMFSCFGRFPVAMIQALMEDAGNPISFSNVPMTREEVSLLGTQVNDVAGWPPLITDTGFGIIIMRYAHHIRFLGIGDDACISGEEMNYFMSSVTNEIRQMAEDCSKPVNIDSIIQQVDVEKVVVQV